MRTAAPIHTRPSRSLAATSRAGALPFRTATTLAPEIEEPEIALPQHLKLMQEWVKDLALEKEQPPT